MSRRKSRRRGRRAGRRSSGTDTAASGAAARALMPDQVAQPEGRAAQGEGQRVERRRLRQAAEGVAPAVRVDQRVVVDRGQHRQVGIDAAQQVSQVVVLAEEGVEAAVHRDRRCRPADVSVQPPTRPPRYGSRSTTSTVTPRSASPVAAASPAMPAADHHDTRAGPTVPLASGSAGRRGMGHPPWIGHRRRLREEGVHDVALPARHRLAVHRGEPVAAQSVTERLRRRRTRSRCAADTGRARRRRVRSRPRGMMIVAHTAFHTAAASRGVAHRVLVHGQRGARAAAARGTCCSCASGSGRLRIR